MARSYINNIDDLKQWFLMCQFPMWNLYRGYHEKLPQTSIIFRQVNKELTVEESFDELEQLINMSCHGGGQFTVYVYGGTANKGYSQKIGIGMTPTTTQVAGINGLHSVAGMVSIGEMQTRLANEKRMWELERDLEDTRAALTANQSTKDRLIDNLIEKFDWNQLAPSINGLISKVSGAIPQPQPIHLQGLPAQPQSVPVQLPAEDQEVGEGYDYHTEQIVPILDVIRPHFDTNEEFIHFLTSVATKFSAQPALFKSMVGG